MTQTVTSRIRGYKIPHIDLLIYSILNTTQHIKVKSCENLLDWRGDLTSVVNQGPWLLIVIPFVKERRREGEKHWRSLKLKNALSALLKINYLVNVAV